VRTSLSDVPCLHLDENFKEREEREVSGKEAVQLWRLIRRSRWANTPPEKRKFLRRSQFSSQELTATLVLQGRVSG